MIGRDTSFGALLEDAQFETQAGVVFIVGTISKDANFWSSGLAFAAAWNRVESYFLFDNIADYQAVQRQEKPWWRRFLGASLGGE